MKIKTWIKYEEKYIPARCRKPRYEEKEDYIFAELKEVPKEKLKLAFEDKSRGGAGEIYHYNNKLWSKAKRNPSIGNLYNGKPSALNDLIYAYQKSSKFFRLSYDREILGIDTSREAVIADVEKELKKYILVDGELLTITSEPIYLIMTFGIGNNHGGTGLFVAYCDDIKAVSEQYAFSALESDMAIECANNIAKRRGDTDDVGKFEPLIICHMPKLVSFKRKKVC